MVVLRDLKMSRGYGADSADKIIFKNYVSDLKSPSTPLASKKRVLIYLNTFPEGNIEEM